MAFPQCTSELLKYLTLEGRVSWVIPTTPRETYSDQSNYIGDSIYLLVQAEVHGPWRVGAGSPSHCHL